MRTRKLSLGLVMLMLIGVLVSAGAASAQDQTGPNLLRNAGFEEGHYNQNNIPQIAVPNEWTMHWTDGVTVFGTEWPSARPETVVWNSEGGVPEGEEKYWKDGIYTMKIFKPWAPMHAALSQDVRGLEVGRTYRLVVPIFVDVYEEYRDGQKVTPERLDAGRVRLGASPVGAAWRDENAINYSGWWTGASISPFYQATPTFVHDFVATHPDMTVWIEMGSTNPYANNGFFLDLPGLFATNATGAVAPAAAAPSGAGAAPAAVAQPLATIAPPTPRDDGSIVHVVEAGDSLWVIAIKYASVVNRTPEEMLTYLQEINNIPTFLNAGDEILISPATGSAPAEEAPAEGEATPEAAVEGAEGESTPVEGEVVEGEAPVEGAAEEQPVTEEVQAPAEIAVAAEAAPAEVIAGTICVAAFGDTNANGLREAEEGLIPNAAIAIARAGATVNTYITDGVSEPYCFTLTEPDSYQMTIYPPADFVPTTESSWAVAVSNGESYTVSFGLQEGQAVASTDAGADTAAASSETADEEAASTGSALMDNLGFIVLGVAGVLVLMAIAGVVLLRRG